MKRSVVVVALCLIISRSGTFAAEFSAKGSIADTIEASNNYFLSKSPSGYTARSLSRIDLGFLAATPTTRYSLDTDYSYYKYFGPGAKDTTLTWGTPFDLKFGVSHDANPLTKFNFAASWSRSDLATTLLQQTGTAAGRGTLDTYSVNGGVQRDVTARDSVSWSASATTVSYSDPAQTPYIDYATNGAWTHRVSPSTTVTTSVGVDWLKVDNISDSQRLFWNPTTAFQTQLTKRLSVNGAIGYGFVNAWQNGNAQLAAPPGVPIFQQQAGATSGWIGNAGMNYQISNDTRVSLIAAKSIVPTVLGQLQTIESAGSTLNHDINRFSSLTFVTQFSHSKTAAVGATPAAASDTFTASASYGYKLAREWRSNVSYTYSQINSQSGLERASTVLVSLTHDFTLYGKPPAALVKTPSELALEDLVRAQQVLPTFRP